MNCNDVKSTIELIEELLNYVNGKKVQSYVLKTRIDRILIRLEVIKKERNIESLVKENCKLELRCNSGGCYGGDDSINKDNLVGELNRIKDILLNIEE